MAFLVPSDKEQLQLLQNVVKWTPGRDNIRPTPRVKQHKGLFDENLRKMYDCTQSYILIELFDYPCDFVPEHAGMLRVHVPRAEREQLVHRSAWEVQGFPYDLPQGTHHGVMWYTWSPADGLAVDTIDADVRAALRKQMGHARFLFVWYENPKMTVPEVYHARRLLQN